MIVYAVAADRHGYVPTHNTIFSQGGLDDPNNRTKLIFEEKAGLSPKLPDEPLQVYRMETGEPVWDIWAPIYVRDRHWGAFHVGISIEQINMLRPYDILARYGGDEFVILIPGTSQVQAREAAERIREYVSNSVLEVDGKRLKITLSMGIATLDRLPSESPEKAADRLLSAADERLYQAKHRGRNCVV